MDQTQSEPLLALLAVGDLRSDGLACDAAALVLRNPHLVADLLEALSHGIVNHLAYIERRYHRIILTIIREQLRYAPAQATRNRKPLEQPAPFGSTWELR